MDELFTKNGELIPKQEWESLMDSLSTGFDGLETNKERASRRISIVFEEAVRKRAMNLDYYGVLLSGGVDSSLIALLAKKHNPHFTCYTVGLENSLDVESAKALASKYDLKLECQTLSLDDFEKNLKETIKVLNSSEIVWVSVGSVLMATAKMALKDNVKILLGGLGSEEIFAGYQRHESAFGSKNFGMVHDECWNGLKNMWERDLLRDYRISKHFGIDVRTPFMDEEVVKEAMKTHPMYKLSLDKKKIILREMAEDFGLSAEFAWRRKKAAQYGSNFVNGIDKLAKKKGFSTKKEYLQSMI